MITHMLTCAIVDDERTARTGLRNYINRTHNLNCVSECSDAASFEAYLRQNRAPNIVFMDICMPGMSGIDFIASHALGTAFIIVTAYEQYAIKGYDLNVTDYLLKPVSYSRFMQAVEKAAHFIGARPDAGADESIFVRADGLTHRIALHDIVYLEAMENYVRVFTTTDRIITRTTLKDILSRLPAKEFIQVHKSYVVSLAHIARISGSTIIMSPFGEIPTSRTYRHKILAMTNGR